MDIIIKNKNFILSETFFCGQCFRWGEAGENTFFGIAYNKELLIVQNKDEIILKDVEESDREFWEDYFDIGTDYGKLIENFSVDETLKKACLEYSGIRILKQEPFETLISFIISQNNNIKRITGIVKRLCEQFGEKLYNGYSFPAAEKLAVLSEEDLAPLRAGFRNRYILDAARKVASGEVNLEKIKDMDYGTARSELMKIVGVGEKVADCVLLFGFYKLEAFPKDVWIKRIVGEFYPNGLPDCIKGAEGIAQQYLFMYAKGRN